MHDEGRNRAETKHTDHDHREYRVIESIAIAVGIVDRAEQLESADPVINQAGTARRVEDQLFQSRRRIRAPPADLCPPRETVPDRQW